MSFMQGIYTYIPETNNIPREYSAASILLLLFMVLISLVSVLNLLYFYISTFRSMCAVPNMAVLCSSFTSCFPGMLLMYFLYVIIIIIIIISSSSSTMLLLLLLLLSYEEVTQCPLIRWPQMKLEHLVKASQQNHNGRTEICRSATESIHRTWTTLGLKNPGFRGEKLATELHGTNTRKVHTSTNFTDQLQFVFMY